MFLNDILRIAKLDLGFFKNVSSVSVFFCVKTNKPKSVPFQPVTF